MAIENAATNNRLFLKTAGIYYLFFFIFLIIFNVAMFLSYIYPKSFVLGTRNFVEIGEFELALIVFMVLSLMIIVLSVYSILFKAQEGLVSITSKGV